MGVLLSCRSVLRKTSSPISLAVFSILSDSSIFLGAIMRRSPGNVEKALKKHLKQILLHLRGHFRQPIYRLRDQGKASSAKCHALPFALEASPGQILCFLLLLSLPGQLRFQEAVFLSSSDCIMHNVNRFKTGLIRNENLS